MGAWIEISCGTSDGKWSSVAPYMGAWIEIYKSLLSAHKKSVAPYMGAWIEIFLQRSNVLLDMSHPTWVRGLKYKSMAICQSCGQSHPTWVRGLKFLKLYDIIFISLVAPYMGAWIEILQFTK